MEKFRGLREIFVNNLFVKTAWERFIRFVRFSSSCQVPVNGRLLFFLAVKTSCPCIPRLLWNIVERRTRSFFKKFLSKYFSRRIFRDAWMETYGGQLESIYRVTNGGDKLENGKKEP